MAGDELGDDLGIGSAMEDHAVGFELALQDSVILDDAVVDHRDGPVTADVRMSVAVGGRPVRGPAGMADAGASADRAVAQELHQVGDAAGAFADLQTAAVQHRQPGAIVAAILQPAQAVQERGLCFAIADVTDNATHGPVPRRRMCVKAGQL